MKNSTRGFTLIELLVVIAIIGLLSSVVLASLKSAREKAGDARTKGQLSSVRAAAESYYNDKGNYGANNTANNSVCTFTSADAYGLYNLTKVGTNYYDGNAPTCVTDAGASSAATKWAAYHVLTDGSYWCADSTGKSKSYASTWTAPTNGASAVCP